MGIDKDNMYVRKHPNELKLTGKERKVLLDIAPMVSDNDIVSKNGRLLLNRLKGDTKGEQIKELNRIFQSSGLRNAPKNEQERKERNNERQKKFKQKFIEETGVDYYQARAAFKGDGKNKDKKFSKKVAKRVAKDVSKKILKHYVGSITFELDVKKDGKILRKKFWLPIDVKTNPKSLKKELGKRAQEFLDQHDYEVYDGGNGNSGPIERDIFWNKFFKDMGLAGYGNDLTEVKDVKAEDTKMKNLEAIEIEGYVAPSKFDRGNNQCVFDWINSQYSTIGHGFTKICSNYHSLAQIFVDGNCPSDSKLQCEIDDCEDNDCDGCVFKSKVNDVLTNGVSAKNLKNFCKYYSLPMYALDCVENIIMTYHPEKRNKHAKALIYKISNNHIYPVVGKNETQSVIQKYSSDVNGSRVFSQEIVNDADIVQKKYEIIAKEDIYDSYQYLYEIATDENKIPRKINMDKKHGGISSFIINDKQYIINQNYEVRKQICDNLQLEWNNQGFIELINHICGEWQKSQPNPETMKILEQSKKNRAQSGFISGMEHYMKAYPNECKSYDIIKCYSSIMYEPLSKWIMIDFNSRFLDWEDDMTDEDITEGLYLVKTQDNILFKKNGVYSHSVLLKAIEEDIDFTIIKYMKATKLLPKTYFTDKINKIMNVLNNKVHQKFLINMLSGLMAMTKNKTFNLHYTQSIDDTFHYISQYAHLVDKNIWNKINDKAFVYGCQNDIHFAENNIPIYIQITGEANIKMYDYIKGIGGKLVARKTDCFVIYKPENTIELNNSWGGLREEQSLPKITFTERFNDTIIQDVKQEIYDDWNTHEYNSSDDYKEIFDIATNNGGVLIQGKAGTGKSYVINQGITGIGNYQRIAPTNKAALNINGTTIHKFLRMDIEMKLRNSFVKKIRKEKLKYIIVDEISMINKCMWNKLQLLKKSIPELIFILVGDHRQCKPIEDDNTKSMKYFDHPVVKYLTNNNRVVLEKIQRYDNDLANLLENVNDINTQEFPEKNTPKNLCFFNNTRKQVNTIWNNKLKKNNHILIKADPDDDYSQDTYIYEGLPVISLITSKDGDIVKSETFTVSSFDDKKITIYNTRTDEEGPYTHTVEIKIDEFHKFAMNYCSTVHKSQGDTFEEDYTIYDWKAMDTELRYTSLSRGKRYNQFGFNSSLKIERKFSPDKFTKNIENKLKAHKEEDNQKNREFNLDVSDIKKQHKKQQGLCAICCDEYLTANYSKFNKKQFSIDRVNSKYGHIQGNIQICCYSCNISKNNSY